ncbi:MULTISPECIES: IucA/IucC family protein [unclassified Streptomyces]|uniref:IucA/IucC family protein n=1 Tax=unclassified Streptomyces TaxID=2593676 RepID=UPI0003A7487D|nr:MULTISPECIES: IucA/IucC family protein [unclassified Streptomyces]
MRDLQDLRPSPSMEHDDPLLVAADEVRASRPELAGPFLRSLPGAQATVLGRLWGAFAREPLPGITGRRRTGGDLTVSLEGGGCLSGDAAAAERFARTPPGFTVGTPAGAVSDPVRLLAALGLRTPAARTLSAELANSVANLALARAAAGTGRPVVRDSVDAEQAVVDGHPQHPCCRTRTGLSVAEVLAYAPEYRPVIEMSLLAVPAGRWQQAGTWPAELRDGDTVLMPLHPWQRDHVLPRFAGLSLSGRSVTARPLMSLRTLAPLDALPGCHVKTSLDVQLTNYRRTIAPAEVADGPVLSDLVAAVVEKSGHADRLSVLRELGGGAVRVDGQPCSSLGSMVRESADRYTGPDEIAAPLTAVYATEAALISGEAVDWLGEFAELVLPPALTLLSMGVALEAHGQNTLVVLRQGRPVRVLYRDLDGVRVSGRRLAACGFELPRLAGSRAGEDPFALRAKLFGGLLSGVFGELVAVLSRARGADPGDLWAVIAGVARRVFAALRAEDGDEEAFFATAWPLKATTAMRLAGTPGKAQWVEVPNPVAAHRGSTRREVRR